jgi:hypothetical protein
MRLPRLRVGVEHAREQRVLGVPGPAEPEDGFTLAQPHTMVVEDVPQAAVRPALIAKLFLLQHRQADVAKARVRRRTHALRERDVAKGPGGEDQVHRTDLRAGCVGQIRVA